MHWWCKTNKRRVLKRGESNSFEAFSKLPWIVIHSHSPQSWCQHAISTCICRMLVNGLVSARWRREVERAKGRKVVVMKVTRPKIFASSESACSVCRDLFHGCFAEGSVEDEIDACYQAIMKVDVPQVRLSGSGWRWMKMERSGKIVLKSLPFGNFGRLRGRPSAARCKDYSDKTLRACALWRECEVDLCVIFVPNKLHQKIHVYCRLFEHFDLILHNFTGLRGLGWGQILCEFILGIPESFGWKHPVLPVSGVGVLFPQDRTQGWRRHSDLPTRWHLTSWSFYVRTFVCCRLCPRSGWGDITKTYIRLYQSGFTMLLSKWKWHEKNKDEAWMK